MISEMDSVLDSLDEMEKRLDYDLWRACAGNMTQIPPVNTKVYYFPQGHAEHFGKKIDFLRFPRISGLVPCRVQSIKYLADADSDEVYVKIGLVPLGVDEDDDDGEWSGFNFDEDDDNSFAKTLTQSDANNGGGFSVPRYCAEMILPPLNLKNDPPVQSIFVKDVQGEVWKFRHIFRGTPRRHLLTTGWSNFVNRKKLVAGDSIVFMRGENGDVYVGIRRAKKGYGGGTESSLGKWNARGLYGSRSSFKNGIGIGIGGGSNSNSFDLGMKEKGESVVKAATLASNGQPFEVVYYPRGSTPEFVVRICAVKYAMRIPWCAGMRFRMPFEAQDSSPISWFSGTVSDAQVNDPVHWPDSPWRFLQVAWDEPDLLKNLKRVNPWLVEPVPSIPAIHPYPYLAASKRPRLPPPPSGQPTLLSNPLSPSSPLCFFDNISAGIQGARHAQYMLPSPDFNFNHLQMGSGPLDYTARFRASENSNVDDPIENEKKIEAKTPAFFLFGKPIYKEEQLSESSASDGDQENVANVSNGSGSAVIQESPAEASSDGNNN